MVSSLPGDAIASTANWEAKTGKNVFPPGSGGQRSEMMVLSGRAASGVSRKGPFLPLQLRVAPAFLGLCLHHFSLCLRPHMATFSMAVSPFQTPGIAFRAPRPHLNLVTSAKTLFPRKVTF